MKKALLTFVLAVMATGTAMAAPSIAVMDPQWVFNSTDAAKEAEKQIRAMAEKAQAEIDALEAPVLEERDQLQSKKGIVSAEKYMEEEAELRKKIREVRADVQNIQEELERERIKLLKRVRDAVDAAIEEYAKDKNYDLIIPRGLLLHAEDNVDVSEDVLKIANKKLEN